MMRERRGLSRSAGDGDRRLGEGQLVLQHCGQSAREMDVQSRGRLSSEPPPLVPFLRLPEDD
jgi:hypothetical protein